MDFTISKEERRYLLGLARESISAHLDGRRIRIEYPPELRELIDSGKSALHIPCGAFVTLTMGSALRGCIGRMVGIKSLEETVREMAVSAAFEDPRFPPLGADELPRCSIEISVLSPMEKCSDPRSVVVGTHGLYLIYHGRSGVLLPQVPVEQGWNLDEYLDYICRKAGVPPFSYNQKDAELYTFTATVFSERDTR